MTRRLAVAGCFFAGVAFGAERFTVKDSIEMVRFHAPDAGAAALRPLEFNQSPDGTKVAFTLQQGNLASGGTLFWISIISTQVLPEYPLERLVSFGTATNYPAIEEVRWLPDSRRLIFIGRDKNEPAQVYLYDLERRILQQLTAHPGDVTRFALSQNGSVVVYAARTYPDLSKRNMEGYVVKSDYVGTFLWTEPKEFPHIRHYVLDLSTGKTLLIDTPPSRYADEIHLSPSGRHAAFISFDLQGLPLEWSRDANLAKVARLNIAASHHENPEALLDSDAFGRSNWFGRWMLVDSATGMAKMALDVPALAQNGLDIAWPENEASIRLIEKDPRPAVRRQPKFELSIRQDMNTPANIVAKNTITGEEKVITDLNPQLRKFDLGVVEVFDWQDAQGRIYHGGLMLPPHYETSHRYPVVIQTYGFDPNTFQVDGPFGINSGYAARMLTAHGMLVLQMPLRAAAPESGSCEEWVRCGENPLFLQKLESGIDALNSRRLIDPDRIGMIGFSREGMHVFNAVTFSQRKIAAASVIDSVGSSPFAYALVYGMSFPGMLEFEDDSLYGGQFWGDDIDAWRERSPIFHLDNIQAAVRFESFGKAMPHYFDAFAMLKRHGRAAEYVHIPNASHLLQSPAARYTSQQGNVDWFRFWLKDEVDDAPEKQEQYVRWKVMKARNEASQPTP